MRFDELLDHGRDHLTRFDRGHGLMAIVDVPLVGVSHLGRGIAQDTAAAVVGDHISESPEAQVSADHVTLPEGPAQRGPVQAHHARSGFEPIGQVQAVFFRGFQQGKAFGHFRGHGEVFPADLGFGNGLR